MAIRGSLAICAGAAVLALSGCGDSAQLSPPCTARTQELVARTVGVASNRVATKRSIANNGYPQCSYTTDLPDGKRFGITVNVYNGPQPYAVLTRTIVEKQQVFSPTRLVPAPLNVTGLGLLAAWFPDYKQLQSTEGVRLVTTTVRWPGARQPAEIHFATRISRLFLGRNRPSLAKMYP